MDDLSLQRWSLTSDPGFCCPLTLTLTPNPLSGMWMAWEGEAWLAKALRGTQWYVQPSVTELVHRPDNVVANLGTKVTNPAVVLAMGKPTCALVKSQGASLCSEHSTFVIVCVALCGRAEQSLCPCYCCIPTLSVSQLHCLVTFFLM